MIKHVFVFTALDEQYLLNILLFYVILKIPLNLSMYDLLIFFMYFGVSG